MAESDICDNLGSQKLKSSLRLKSNKPKKTSQKSLKQESPKNPNKRVPDKTLSVAELVDESYG